MMASFDLGAFFSRALESWHIGRPEIPFTSNDLASPVYPQWQVIGST